MDTHATTVVNCMLLALKTYPFKIYINDSNGMSAFNPMTELNLTNGPTVLKAEYSLHGSAPTSASARYKKKKKQNVIIRSSQFLIIFKFSD